MTPRQAKPSTKTLSPDKTSVSYRMPAEWEPHESTWLAWPHFRGDWPGKFEPIPWVYAEIIRHLARHEYVDLIVNDRESERRARKVLDRANAHPKECPVPPLADRPRVDPGFGVHVCHIPGQRRPADKGRLGRRSSGASTPGPSTRTGSGTRESATRWLRLPARRQSALSTSDKRVVLEGGSIDVNGEGVLLTTEECLLSPVQERNRGFKREDYEDVFAQYLGIKKVIWLGSGVEGDDTHGHVDDITRFVAPDTILTMVEPDENDPNHEPLRENLRRLKSAADAEGRRFRVVELPMPSPVVFAGRRLPASYGNFYIANGLVLVPVFNDPNDRIALNTLADLFPDREVIGIYSGDLIWGFGAMHCMTQQQPAVGR